MQQTSKRNLALKCIAVLTLVALLIALSFNPPGHPSVKIAFAGYTNAPNGALVALLTLSNEGERSLLRHQFPTIYWTDAKGSNQYRYVSLTPPTYVLRPHALETVSIEISDVREPWDSDFGFSIQPDPVQRAVEQVRNRIFSRHQAAGSYDQLYGFPGPLIGATNNSGLPLGRPR